MQIEERAVGDVVVLDLKGKITLGEGDELLKDKVNSLVNQGHKKIVLNLADVPYIDSAGLGEVVRTYTTVSRQGGSLKLLNLTKRITDLLSITKLLTVFETFDSEDEAVRASRRRPRSSHVTRARWRAALHPRGGARCCGIPRCRAARVALQPAPARCVRPSGPRTSSSSPACCSASASSIAAAIGDAVGGVRRASACCPASST